MAWSNEKTRDIKYIDRCLTIGKSFLTSLFIPVDGQRRLHSPSQQPAPPRGLPAAPPTPQQPLSTASQGRGHHLSLHLSEFLYRPDPAQQPKARPATVGPERGLKPTSTTFRPLRGIRLLPRDHSAPAPPITRQHQQQAWASFSSE